MYNNYFGFKEKPFKLVPNPAYLFLSRTHEEAFAHLRYAISQGDGFVLITGEVGTGKTTLCRAFLESLNDKTEAAFIFNPKLDSIQLLKAINDEFEISSDGNNTKDLIDVLNSFLMEKKAEGKNVILLIDEAQNLTEDVLEQLRLLSNLETSVSKLLQIVLVGQPELGNMLDSYELRQLGQRIALSCHLIPLTNKETREYIQHRINIAAQKPGLGFSRAAFRLIYRYSKGIPRLINIACDRVLLTAFGLNRQRITRKIASMAIRELGTRGDIIGYSPGKRKREIILFSTLCLIFLAVLFNNPVVIENKNILREAENIVPEIHQPEPLVKTEAEAVADVVAAPWPKPAKTEVKRAVEPKIIQDFQAFLKGADAPLSRHTALKTVLDLWGYGSEINPHLEGIDKNQTFFRLAASQNGFSINRMVYDLELIRKLNLPVIIGFHPPGNLSLVYLTICRIENDRIVLKGGSGNDTIEVKPEELEYYSFGFVYILWKNFSSCSGKIPLDAPPESIITLKMLLHDIGFNEVDISPVYDEKTELIVRKIQGKHGIKIDGIVGPLTKISIYNEIKSLKIPHIVG